MNRKMKHIFVIYVGCSEFKDNLTRVGELCETVREEFSKGYNDGIFYIIPDFATNNIKIDCINPVYINKKKLVQTHEFRLIELYDKMNETLDMFKNDKNLIELNTKISETLNILKNGE